MSRSVYDELSALLTQRREAPDAARRAAVDAQVNARFRKRLAILVLDMSGFSRITQEEGIIHFLEMIHRMHDLSFPVVRRFNGEVVKTLADNLFAVFQTPRAAALAALEIHRACAVDARERLPNEVVSVSIGLGWGQMLYLDGSDCFGDEVNLAFKLGEDIADHHETLATEALAAALDPALIAEARRVHISAIELPYFVLQDA